jgi:hypothetical protein
LLEEFVFANQRSKSVAVAAMVGVHALGVLPPKSIRPCFLYLANAEGAGKSVLEVSLSLQPLFLIPLETNANYFVFGADVSAFAKQYV